jgi:hypothetical protein
MQLVYAKEPLTVEVRELSIFLAGPTPRSLSLFASDRSTPSWRPDAIAVLERLRFPGHVLVPEPRDGTWSGEYTDQIEWEADAMDAASVIVFWLPRKLDTMQGFTTNDEWGYWKASGKVIFGAPLWAEKVTYQRWWANRLGVPSFETLDDTIAAAFDFVNPLLTSGFS